MRRDDQVVASLYRCYDIFRAALSDDAAEGANQEIRHSTQLIFSLVDLANFDNERLTLNIDLSKRWVSCWLPVLLEKPSLRMSSCYANCVEW